MAVSGVLCVYDWPTEFPIISDPVKISEMGHLLSGGATRCKMDLTDPHFIKSRNRFLPHCEFGTIEIEGGKYPGVKWTLPRGFVFRWPEIRFPCVAHFAKVQMPRFMSAPAAD